METTVNERIKLLRTQLNLSPEDFATKCNINRITLYRIEKGEGEPMHKTLKGIATSLNVNYDWLTLGKGKMFNDKTKEITTPSVDPWKDALVSQVKEENNRLQKEVERLWQMVSHFTGGAKPNFRKATEYAYNTLALPKGKTSAVGSVALNA